MNSTEFKSYPNGAQSFGITGIVILGMILLSPVIVLLNYFLAKEPVILIYYILAVGIPFWIVYSIRKSKTGDTSFNLKIENKRIIPLVIIGTLALLFGIISPVGELIPMPESVKKMFYEFAGQNGIYAFILLVIAAPVLEELIFRGIILEGLLKNYSPLKSILISSFLFGLVHLNPWQFFTGFFIGIFIGWIYYKTRSLTFPVIIHATANLTAYFTRAFIDLETLIDKSSIEIFGGFTNYMIVIIGSIFIGSICLYFLMKEFRKERIVEKQSIL
ncbi:MAG: lysostaphin resistance A-like protein [Bacteroidales bacterium]